MSDYFSALEGQLRTAAAGGGGRGRRRGGRALLLAAAILVLAGVPVAAAVTGAFDRRSDDARDVSRLMRQAPIAEGVQSNGARWLLVASDDSRGFCFGLLTPSNHPSAIAPGGGASCDGHPPGVLTVVAASTTSSRYAPSPRHSLAYGTAPDAAVRVELSVGASRLTVATLDDPKGIEGRFYVAEIPLRWQRQRRHARAFDSNGKVIARAGG